METSSFVLGKIEENMPAIRRFGISKIGLFGSCSRGEQADCSDVDILVEFKKGRKTFDNYMDLKFFLEDLFGRRVDLVIMETLKPDLKASIMGSVLYAQGA